MSAIRATSIMRPATSSGIAHGAPTATTRTSPRNATPALAVLAASGSVGAGILALQQQRDSRRPAAKAPIADGARGATQLQPVPSSSNIRTTPGAHLLQLSRTATEPATSAAHPASFSQMHRADGLGWAAGDGTISVPLPDGRSLWLYGDTMLNLPGADGTIRRNAGMVRNSAVIQDGATLTTLTTGTDQNPDDFLKPPGESDRWYWPAHGLVEDDELIVFMGRTRETNDITPGWNFAGDGSDMVRMSLSDLSVREVTRMPGGKDMTWGTSVVSDDSHTYIYGMEDGREPTDRWAHVARVAKGHVGDGAFEYWDGAAWTRDASRSARLADGVSNQFTVTRTPKGRWALITQDPFFSSALSVRTASTPHGPWGKAHRIDAGPKLSSDQISYNAMAHPQFNADGKLLVGWNLNRSDGQPPSPSQLDDYRPKFRAIDLDRLDS